MKQYLTKTVSCGVAGIALMMLPAAPVLAETITIRKGTGIVWEGLPFNETLSGPMKTEYLDPSSPLLIVSDNINWYMTTYDLKNIGGYMAFPISGLPGLGLVPRASGSATYTFQVSYQLYDGTLTGTIGLPETRGSSTNQSYITPQGRQAWCLNSKTVNDLKSGFYWGTSPRTATLSGKWVIVADGTQKSGESSLPAMYFSTFSYNSEGRKSTPILRPTGITLRVSTLECSINTPTAIDFGAVSRNPQAGAELAVKPVQLTATCGQSTDRINANINVQFRALSGLYNGTASRLALNQGGGYITGEIDKGVTGSGECNAATGLRFDNTPVKLGRITSGESSKILTNQLTWRLCSGGSSVPSGAVTGSAEMLVTFN
ncbi:TPA: hypothetical protein ACHBXQ_005220 [Klebsiella variicola subsp. variicola]